MALTMYNLLLTPVNCHPSGEFSSGLSRALWPPHLLLLQHLPPCVGNVFNWHGFLPCKGGVVLRITLERASASLLGTAWKNTLSWGVGLSLSLHASSQALTQRWLAPPSHGASCHLLAACHPRSS